MYNLIKNMTHTCNLNAVYHYVKVCFIQAPAEAALSLFIIESLLIFTPYFRVSGSPLSVSDVFPIVLSPIFFGAIVCVLYTFFVSLLFLFFINSMSKIETNDLDYLYVQIDNESIKLFKTIHTIGFVCYCFVAAFFVYFVLNDILFIDKNLTKAYSFAFGALFGAIWNILGFYGDRSIHWSKVFQTLGNYKNTKIENEKLKYHAAYTLIHLIIIVSISVGLLLIISNPHDTILENGFNLANLDFLTLSFLISAATVIVNLYIKYIYRLHYDKKQAGRLYYLLNDITNVDKKRLLRFAPSRDSLKQ